MLVARHLAHLQILPKFAAPVIIFASMLSLPQSALAAVAVPFRAPRRVSVTLPYAVYAVLVSTSDEQGRSLSNYAAHLLELNMARSSDSARTERLSGRRWR